MLRETILLAMATCACAHYSLAQIIDDSYAVQGIAIAHTLKYVAVGDYTGDIRIYEKNGSIWQFHQAFLNSSYIIEQAVFSDDYWLAVADYTNPRIYTLDRVTNKFELFQQLEEDMVASIQISGDHEWLALGTNDAKVIIYRLMKGKYQLQQRIQISSDYRIFMLSMTPDATELVAALGYSVRVLTNIGGNFVINTTINYPFYSFRSVKLTQDHRCLAIASRDYSYVEIYKRVGSDIILWQNITEKASSVDLTPDCQQMVLGLNNYAIYYESDGKTFTQVQQLPTDSEPLMCSRITHDNQYLFLGSTTGALYIYSMDSTLSSL